MNTIKKSREIFESFTNYELLSFEDQLTIMRFINNDLKTENPYKSSDYVLLEEILTATDSDISDLAGFEFSEYMEKVSNLSDDNWIETPTGEVRVIDDNEIDEIWTESLIEQIKECYDLSDVPSFVEIDWEKTADNCKVDGMGHHFATYDGEEKEYNGWWIFRTN